MFTRTAAVLFLLASLSSAQSIRFTNVLIYDGSGSPPRKGEVRIQGDTIIAIAKKLRAEKEETIIDGRGHALAPGFIDMHSHADRGIFEKPHDAVIRQGITTVLVGQDGGSIYPLRDFFAKLQKQPAAMNVASMSGHGTIRRQVMGQDVLRPATPQEIEKMHLLVHNELVDGAMGVSTGLEYDAGQFAHIDELVEMATMTQGHGGFYISHVRDEGNGVFKSFAEIVNIGERAKAPVQITHIKLGSTPVWRQAATRMPAVFADAEKRGVKLTADVYPYTFWQSTLRVIVLDRDYYNAEKVKKAIADNGGPERLRITSYKKDSSLQDKTLGQIARIWQVAPQEAFMRLVRSTEGGDDDDEVTVLGESMHEDDIKWFIAHPKIMFCTDGELQGKHPRGAGAFPRILGRYVREMKVIKLEEAVRKMTSQPASQLGLKDRGRIAAGFKADVVLFDPKTVSDRSTVEKPLQPPVGISHVMVNGQWVVKDGAVEKVRPGTVLKIASAKE